MQFFVVVGLFVSAVCAIIIIIIMIGANLTTNCELLFQYLTCSAGS